MLTFSDHKMEMNSILNSAKLFIVLFIAITLRLQGQDGNCAIKIAISDKTSKDMILDSVSILLNNFGIQKYKPNEDGEFVIKKLNPGKYSVTAAVLSYKTVQMKKVIVGEGRTCYLNISMEKNDPGAKRTGRKK